MSEFWDKMKSGIKDGASFSATKISEYSKIGKLKIEQFGLQKKIDTTYSDMGKLLYELSKESKIATVTDNIEIAESIDSIDLHKEEIEALAIEIEQIREEALLKQQEYRETKESEDESTSDDSTVDKIEPKDDESEDEVLGI